jgi:hypothetical protein
MFQKTKRLLLPWAKKTTALLLAGSFLTFNLLPLTYPAQAQEFPLTLPSQTELTPNQEQTIQQKVQSLGVPFIENQGQLDNPKVKYYTNIFAGQVFVQDDQLTYKIKEKEEREDLQDLAQRPEPPSPEERMNRKEKGYVFNEKFINTQNPPALQGINPSPTQISFFQKDLSNSGQFSYYDVNYGQLWNNIEVSLRADKQNIEKIFQVNPQGDPQDIQLQFEGIDHIGISEKNELVLTTPSGEISMTAPIAYQEENGQRTDIEVTYQLLDNQTYGFQVGQYDKSKSLIIDPLLAGTSFGSGGLGNWLDYGKLYLIETDPAGNIYAAGGTFSSNFPVTVGAYDTTFNGGGYNGEAFIAKFNSDLSELLAATFFGDVDETVDVGGLLINGGNVIISGTVHDDGDGPSIPTTSGAYRETAYGKDDMYVAILPSSLDALLYSTYLGGTDDDYLYGMDIDSTGDVFVTGYTESSDLPCVGGYTCVLGSADNAFVAKFSGDLSSLEASTFFGADSNHHADDILVDASDKIYVTGRVYSPVTAGFPTTP